MSSLLELISIHELLRDRQYREYFLKPPTLPDHYVNSQPWKLLLLRQGETAWRSKRFASYRDAFGMLKSELPHIINGAINCPPLDFMPPIKNYKVKGKFVGNGHLKRPLIVTKVWKPSLTADMGDHSWCPYCRRPSIFRTAIIRRPARNGFDLIPGEPEERCMICGASVRIIDLRHPERNTQRWDPNRPKVYV